MFPRSAAVEPESEISCGHVTGVCSQTRWRPGKWFRYLWFFPLRNLCRIYSRSPTTSDGIIVRALFAININEQKVRRIPLKLLLLLYKSLLLLLFLFTFLRWFFWEFTKCNLQLKLFAKLGDEKRCVDRSVLDI